MWERAWRLAERYELRLTGNLTSGLKYDRRYLTVSQAKKIARTNRPPPEAVSRGVAWLIRQQHLLLQACRINRYLAEHPALAPTGHGDVGAEDGETLDGHADPTEADSL